MCITELDVRSNGGGSSNSKYNSRHLIACGQAVLGNSMCSSSGGTIIGLCVLDVSSGNCQAGTFCTTADPARSALAAALLMYDPVECVAVRNSLHAATVALVRQHCESKGTAQGLGVDGLGCGSGSKLGGVHIPGLSWLPHAAAAAVLQEPASLLQQLLPAESLQQLEAVVQASSRGPDNSIDKGRSSLALLSAVAVAVAQLQRCSMSHAVLPTLEISAIEGLGKSIGQNPGEWHVCILLRVTCCRSTNQEPMAVLSTLCHRWTNHCASSHVLQKMHACSSHV